MKFFRFMSNDEFKKLIDGETLISNDTHEKCRTSSKGFCFLGEDSIAMSNDGIPYGMDPSTWDQLFYVDSYAKAASVLVGGTCGSDEIFVEFEGNGLTKSVGIYADELSDNWDDFVLVGEYCTTEYNTKLLRPIKAWRKTDFGEWDEEIKFIALEPNYYWNKYGDLEHA